MLRDLVEVRVDEVRRAFGHLHRLFEARGLHLGCRHDTIAVSDSVGGTEVHPRKLACISDEVDGFAHCAYSLQVSKGFANPVQSATVLAKRRYGVCAAWNEDRVEHGAAHAFEVVIWLHTFA